MAATLQISVGEYLGMTDKPACEFIDGALRPKPMPTLDHSWIQTRILTLVMTHFKDYLALAEPTVRIRETEWLVPDVVILRRNRLERPYQTKPVHVCIEILSPEDRFSRMLSKLDSYFEWGVPFCWIFDPVTQKAWVVQPDGIPNEVAFNSSVRAGEIELTVADIFAAP